MKDEVERIINRHIARMMCDLEAAECPALFRHAVKSEMQWLRKDVLSVVDNGPQT